MKNIFNSANTVPPAQHIHRELTILRDRDRGGDTDTGTEKGRAIDPNTRAQQQRKRGQ